MSRSAQLPPSNSPFTANVLLSAWLCLLFAGCARFGFSAAPDGGAAAVETGAADVALDTPPVPGRDAMFDREAAPGDGSAPDHALPPRADGAPDGPTTTDAGVPTMVAAMFQAGGPSAEEATALVVDAQGNITVTGSFGGTADFGGTQLTASGAEDIFIASFDAAGVLRWVRQIQGRTNVSHSASLAVDPAGNIYVTGNVDGIMDCGGGSLPSWGSSDIFVASYTSVGGHRWSSTYGGADHDAGRSISVDDQGRATVTGAFYGVATFSGTNVTSEGYADIFLLRLAADGSLRWVKGIGGGGGDVANAVETAPQGEIFLTGRVDDDAKNPDFGGRTVAVAGSHDGFVAAYSEAGGLRWLETFGGEGTYVDRGDDVALDSAGNVIVGGRFSGSTDFGGGPVTATFPTDLVVVSYSSAGTFRWLRIFPEADTAFIRRVAASPGGTVAVLGSFTASTELGLGPVASNGLRDIFVLYLDDAGQLLSQLTFGGALLDDAYGLAFDGAAGLWIAGFFEGDISYGGTTLSSSGSSDFFALKLNP